VCGFDATVSRNGPYGRCGCHGLDVYVKLAVVDVVSVHSEWQSRIKHHSNLLFCRNWYVATRAWFWHDHTKTNQKYL